jgi:hypothetical protein
MCGSFDFIYRSEFSTIVENSAGHKGSYEIKNNTENLARLSGEGHACFFLQGGRFISIM